MLNDFDIQVGTRFVFGHGAEERCGLEVRSLDASRVLLHYDGGDYLEASGLLSRIRKSLIDAGVEVVELGGVQPNPRLELVYSGIDLCNEHRLEAVVAIGGGSAIDSAKAIGLGAVYDGDVWDLFLGQGEPKTTLPVIAVLTCPASGSESSQVVVVNNEREYAKLLVSHPVVRPAVAIMNPELSCTLPAYPTACGLVDMFCHVCERYFTDDADFGILDRMSEGVMRTIVDVAPRLMLDLGDYALRSEVMWAATIAQNNSLGMGRNQDWSTHALSNELSALYDTPHGASISAVMASWMRYVRSSNPERFARFACKVFNVCDPGLDIDEAGEMGIDRCERFFADLGMPISLEEIGVDGQGIDPMLDKIEFFGPDQAIGSVRRLAREDCAEIFRMALPAREVTRDA